MRCRQGWKSRTKIVKQPIPKSCVRGICKKMERKKKTKHNFPFVSYLCNTIRIKILLFSLSGAENTKSYFFNLYVGCCVYCGSLNSLNPFKPKYEYLQIHIYVLIN